jgi:hypothetical protein
MDRKQPANKRITAGWTGAMQRRTPCIKTLAAVVVAACAAIGTHAQTSQSAPATDTFANNSNVQVYEDDQSRACDKKNNSSPEVDGLNPLACYRAEAGADGKCALTGNATLERQTGNLCYYCQRTLPLAGNGIVVPQDEAGSAQLRNFTCFADEADPACYVGCMGPGTFSPPAGTTRVGSSGSGQQPLQGQAATGPDPCFPAGPKNYNVCSYPNLPRPAGCICSKTPDTPSPAAPAGSKGLQRAQVPAAETSTAPNIPAFNQAMATCLNAQLPYSVPSTVTAAYQQMASTMLPASQLKTPFNQLPAISQIFVTETAMALEAQAIHDTLYGANPYQAQASLDFMVGWLDRCAASAGLRPLSYDSSPNSPWLLYAAYTGTTARENYFTRGFTTFPVNPVPLGPPKAASGLLPLKTSSTTSNSVKER